MRDFGTSFIHRPEQIAAGYPLYAVLQRRHVEMDQQPQWFIVELQICQQLRFVNRVQFRHCFEFQNQHALDHKIQPVTAVELHFFVANWQHPLTLETKPGP